MVYRYTSRNLKGWVKMKISHYMQYLKILKDRYGDIDVKTKITFETLGLHAYEYEHEYADAEKPKYDNKSKSVIVYKEMVNLD